MLVSRDAVIVVPRQRGMSTRGICMIRKIMKNELFPSDVHQKISDLGFFPVSFVELLNFWSVVGIQGDKHYNVQLSKKDLKVSSIHLLKYRWNATGAKILDVQRVAIQ